MSLAENTLLTMRAPPLVMHGLVRASRVAARAAAARSRAVGSWNDAPATKSSSSADSSSATGRHLLRASVRRRV
jgi:hypothetical protein